MTSIYPWLLPVWNKWQALSVADRAPAAMLCSSPEGMGISSLVKHYVRTLVCTESKSEPCGFCHSCALSESENHPDIHWVAPESEGKSITVDQIRLCNRWALESSQLGGKRVIVIQPAEAMNESASNALLKTLESPPENCLFLLLSNNRSKLLATIISRCQLWDIAEPNIEITYDWLKSNCEKPVSYNGIRLSKGAPLKALEFFTDGDSDRYFELEKCFSEEIVKSIPDTPKLFKCIKEEPLKSLYWLALLLSDIQKVHFGVVETGLCGASTLLAEHISYQNAYEFSNRLNKLREQLVTYTGLNTELLFTNWVLELHEEICS
ncbi:DNA polymerase III subunit delta' [Vibrio hannami]|uniref:DNA polymerase III subunit delta' n=1 Tax=Vibrio hannami TaxID=2717094 RepID=UPI00240EC81A|nr:DNA polymerase III subunit delta' [Vibrio hannami]MDG3087630.1 DNA polymerase III subunit delta' [Vibrio hannami]